MIKDLIDKDTRINELENKIDAAIEYMYENKEVLIVIMGTYYYKLLEILGENNE